MTLLFILLALVAFSDPLRLALLAIVVAVLWIGDLRSGHAQRSPY